MLFRNLTLYRLQQPWSGSAADLEQALCGRPLRPCGSFDMQTRGWVPCDEADGALVHALGGHCLLALGQEQKLLPAAVINQEARSRAAQLAATQGHPVGRRQMRELKARVADELRARALTRRRVTHAWLAPRQGWLVVNAAAPGRADELVEVLRDSLGGLPVQPLESRQAPRVAMAAWLGQGGPPGRFALDQDLELRAVEAGGASIRYARHALDAPEIRQHLAAGKQPVRLGLVWQERIAFVLNQNLQLCRLRFLDVYKDDHAQGEDPREQFDIDFALMSGELTQLLEELLAALGGVELAVRQAA